MNERARPDPEALFAALELFVNCGDTASNLHRFRLQHPQLFPQEFYDQSEQLANAGKKDNFFNWLKRLLRAVWEGRDPAGTRLAVLLGIKDVSYVGPPGGDFQAEVTEHMAIFADLISLWEMPTAKDISLAANRLFAARITPDWHGSKLQYEPTIDFQDAVFTLMGESWRARRCRICRCYMIAAKPANTYCSTKCTGDAKRKRDRENWRTKGKARRLKRSKASKK
jgi:hypothetical protein